MARPREFDTADLLHKATLQFWANGYHATSIRDLTARTGVNQYGLYESFGSKHGLYMAALAHYRDTVTRDALKELNKAGPFVKRAQAMLLLLLERMQTADGPVGCLMANAAIEVAPADPDAAAQVRMHMDILRTAFRARLERAVIDGELAVDQPLDHLAEYLTTTTYSLSFLLRSGCDGAYVRRHIKTALAILE